ncbi:hypothetical protein BX666DRAFT_182457 [Dichotomocladium elegans]|nr:hypothetical protein BX666DRAFT_182457 [Dichotomocladium elegans]
MTIVGSDSFQETVGNVIGQLAEATGVKTTEKMQLQEACIKEYYEDSPTKHYELLGRSSLQFVVTQILCKEFGTCSDEILTHMMKLLNVDDVLIKAIGENCRLQAYSSDKTPFTRIVERLIGIITQSALGLMAVMALVTPVLKEYQGFLFSKLPRTLRHSLGISQGKVINPPLSVDTTISPTTPIPRPIATPRTRSDAYAAANQDNSEICTIYQCFSKIVYRNNGATAVDFVDHGIADGRKKWCCRIAFKLTGGSRWFSHMRVGQSKKQAKSMVVRDIVQYYRTRPEQLMADKKMVMMAECLGPPDQAVPLPIPGDELYQEGDAAAAENREGAVPATHAWHNPAPQNPHLISIHISEDPDMSDQEYQKIMMDVLLGDLSSMRMEEVEMEEATERTKKRQRPLITDNSGVLPSPPADRNYALAANDNPIDEEALALQTIRRKLDISRVERMLQDPVQFANPKSSMFSYVYNLPGLQMSSTFEEHGPSHNRIFRACTSITDGEYQIPGYGEGARKSEAERHALISLMKILVG